MRQESEIKRACEIVSNNPGLLDFRGDNFKYGLLVGKIIALEWVQGDAPGFDVSIDYDYAGWVAQLKEAAEETKRMLHNPPDEKK